SIPRASIVHLDSRKSDGKSARSVQGNVGPTKTASSRLGPPNRAATTVQDEIHILLFEHRTIAWQKIPEAECQKAWHSPPVFHEGGPTGSFTGRCGPFSRSWPVPARPAFRSGNREPPAAGQEYQDILPGWPAGRKSGRQTGNHPGRRRQQE